MACGKPPGLALGPRGAAAVVLLRLPMEPACGSIYASVRWPWLSPTQPKIFGELSVCNYETCRNGSIL